jgi:hypothetical protein
MKVRGRGARQRLCKETQPANLPCHGGMDYTLEAIGKEWGTQM